MYTRKTVFCGLFSALILITTYVVKFPVTGAGYVNLGDTMIIISGIVLGPFYGMISACLGATAADIISGYAVYAPMTFVIKGIMALAVGFIWRNTFKKRFYLLSITVAFVSEIIMIFGYLVLEWIFMGRFFALSDVISNLIQGLVCIITTIFFIAIIHKNSYIREHIDKM